MSVSPQHQGLSLCKIIRFRLAVRGKYRLASNYSILGGRKGWRKVCGGRGSEGEKKAGMLVGGEGRKPRKFCFMTARNLEFAS